ncbi:MAG TPA: NAD(P)/FAD-dependent oxidoreductase [Thermomicrobiales bacterium]|nr:NAD(P)/FAD-dependent oxidoreductase [Thermomicrobiales bacterium]
MSDADPQQFDIVVIGGSVAGSAVAATLSDEGYSVALIEREAAFRDRARGEGIHPWGMDEAEELGLLELLRAGGAHPLPVWLTYVDRVPVEPLLMAEHSARGHVEQGVFHPTLQETMLVYAREHRVSVYRPASLVALDRRDDRVFVGVEQDGETISLAAQIVIGADGTHSKTRSQVGIATEKDVLHHWFAGVLIDGFGGDPDAAHSSLVAGGRFFILPQGNGRARAYLALMPVRIAAIQADRSGRALLQLIAEYLPDGMLADAEPAGPQGIFSNADIWPETAAADRIVLIGDAAGTNDPSVGNGIAMALRDVRELRDAIRESGLTQTALELYALRRARYYGALRQYASWMGEIWLEEGPEADAKRVRFRTAREMDPDAGGFNMITMLGPRDLVPTEAARARFFGEAAPTPG